MRLLYKQQRAWVPVQAGLDSLGAVDLRNAVMTKFNMAVPATLAFDYPTIEALAAFIASARRDVLHNAASMQARAVHPAHMPDSAVATQLNAVISSVMGREIEPHQPLMEVSLLLARMRHCLPGLLVSTCAYMPLIRATQGGGRAQA